MAEIPLWILFFALWLGALHRATRQAFTQEGLRTPGIPFVAGPIFAPTIVFHLSHSSMLCALLFAIINEDAQTVLFCLPGALASIIQGTTLYIERKSQLTQPETQRLRAYWMAEQWPFALLGLSIGIAGALWWIQSGSPYPLLLAAFSGFFLWTFWLYFKHQNEIVISPEKVQYVHSFPRFRVYAHERERSKDLLMQLTRRRRGIYDVKVEEPGKSPIELTATLSSNQRLNLEFESYLMRTDQV